MPNIELTVTEDSPIELNVLSDSLVRLGVQEQIINQGGSLSDEAKQALLTVIQNVAFINGDGQDYYDALYAALYPPVALDYITAEYTPSGTIYTTDTLDDLKPDLVVTAYYDDGTSEEVNAYILSGSLTEGTSTITVTYGGKTTTFDVTVSLPYLYKMSTGVIKKEVGTIGAVEDQIAITTGNNKRRVFGIQTGDVLLKTSSNGTTISGDSDLYPIPIPQNATKVTVSITPTTQYVNIYNILYSEENLRYENVGSTSWQQNSYTMDLLPTSEFVFVIGKYNSSGGTYGTEPTELVVQFADS